MNHVNITVFDLIGNEVAVIINQELEAGNHSADFNAASLTSGVYFYKITSGSFTKTMKMLLFK